MEKSIFIEQRRVCLEHLTYRGALGEVGMQSYRNVVSVTGLKYLLSFAPLPSLLGPKGEISDKELL